MRVVRSSRFAMVLTVALMGVTEVEAAKVVVGAQLGDKMQEKAAGPGTWSGFAFSQQTTLNGVANAAPANSFIAWYTLSLKPVATTSLLPPGRKGMPLATTTLPDGTVTNVDLKFGATIYGASVSAAGRRTSSQHLRTPAAT